MLLIFYIETIACFLFTLFLYLKYADKKTKGYVSFLVFTTWLLTFISVVIVPLDIYIVI